MKAQTVIFLLSTLATSLPANGVSRSQPTPVGMVSHAGALQSLTPPYLNQFPAVERIKADVCGMDAMETAAKQAGIFWQLNQLISNLAYAQRRIDRQFTPDEQRMSTDYRNAYYVALQTFEGKVSGSDKPRWFELHTKYEMDTWLLDEVFKKYFTADLRRSVYVALKGQMPTSNAPQGSTLTPNAAEMAAVPKNSSVRVSSATITSSATQAKEYLAEGDKYYEAKQFEKARAAYQQAVAAEPSVSGYNKLGQTLLDLKQYDNAIAAYQKALGLSPNSSNLHLNIGFVWFKKREYIRAATEYRDALRLNPNNEPAYFELGGSLYELEQFSEAAAAFQQSYRLDPSSPESLYRVVEMYLELGNKTEATQILRSLQQVKSKRAKEFEDEYTQLFSSDDPKDLLDLGDGAVEAALRAGDERGSEYALSLFPYALRFFRRAIQLDKSAQTHAQAYRGIASVYSSMKKYEKAIGALQQALKMLPNDPESNFSLGLTYLEAGMKSEAMQVYKLLQKVDRDKAQRLYAEINKQTASAIGGPAAAITNTSSTETPSSKPSKSISANEALSMDSVSGDALFLNGDHALAIKQYINVIERRPDLDSWVSEELESLSESTDTPLKQEWLAAVRKYAASRPTDSSAQILLGDSQTILRDYKTAANSYEKAIKLNTDPLMKAKGFARLGLTYFSMDEFEIASRYLGEALLTKPDDVFALKYQGLAYFKLKQFPRARDILKRASQMGPDESSIAFWLGTTYVELRDYDKAINALLQAQRSKSQYAPAETNVELGKAYLALKRYPSAVAAFQNAIKQKQAIEKSEYPRAYFFLGVTYAWMGRKAEAHQMYQKLLPIDPEGAKSLLVEINSKP